MCGVCVRLSVLTVIHFLVVAEHIVMLTMAAVLLALVIAFCSFHLWLQHSVFSSIMSIMGIMLTNQYCKTDAGTPGLRAIIVHN